MERKILRRAGFATAYFGIACVSLALTRFDNNVAFIWGATAFQIARLVTCDTRREQVWTIVLAYVANLTASALFGAGPALAPLISAIRVGEGVFAVWLLERLRASEHSMLECPGSLTRYVLVIGLAAPLTSAILGPGVLAFALHVPALPGMSTWFIGHSLGNLAFTPLFKLLFAGTFGDELGSKSRRSRADLALVMFMIVVASGLAFGQSRFPLLFLPVVAMIVATFRHGSLGTALSVAVLAVIGCVLTVMGSGPIHLIDAPIGTQMQFLQFYLAANTLAALPLSTVLHQRKLLYDALHRSEESYRMVAENSTDIIMRTDLAGCILYVSPAVEKLAGYRAADLVGSYAGQMIHPDYAEHVRFEHRLALECTSNFTRFEYLALTAEGRERWFESTLQCLVDPEGVPTGAVSIIRDVTDRKALEDQLFEAALTDPLTGLPNRRAFMAQLDSLTEHDGARYVAIFDLDHFKSINDRFGHDAGDKVLAAFADLARAEVREHDLVARLGGEEFAMLFHGAEAGQAQAICQRVIDAFARERIYVDGQRISATVSAGVASVETCAERSLKRADEALYIAKSRGRDQLAQAA